MILFSLPLIHTKNGIENITENAPYINENVDAIFFDGESEAVKSLIACSYELYPS
jgi:hypothetical protein